MNNLRNNIKFRALTNEVVEEYQKTAKICNITNINILNTNENQKELEMWRTFLNLLEAFSE